MEFDLFGPKWANEVLRYQPEVLVHLCLFAFAVGDSRESYMQLKLVFSCTLSGISFLKKMKVKFTAKVTNIPNSRLQEK